MEAHNGNSPVRHYRLKPQILAIICTETSIEGTKAGENKEAGRNRALRRKISYKKYYEKNKDMLREKARERAARAKLRRMEVETPEQAEARKQRLLQAAARYRAALKIRNQQARELYARQLECSM
ncbi:hypothetical protein CVT26_012234 [Gymnopilus dilepis]|uniref:Uncharacterized protein n=1 Tax=Gymnopilus dilepis TaxID=231916 RepID=A0A409YQ69_9AGAR|nr:hypothetical protein CVT26_012234 [Gymnopilus dilepis]